MLVRTHTLIGDSLLLFLLAAQYAMAQGGTLVIGVYFMQFQIHLGASASEASLAVGIPTAVSFLGGPLYGIMFSVLGYKRAVIIGGLLCGLGYIAASLVRSIAALQLVLAMLVGGGVGALHISIMSVAGKAFTAKRAFANAVITGSPRLAAIAFGPIAHDLVATFSWRWSLRILGAIIFNSIPAGLASNWFIVKGHTQVPRKENHESGNHVSRDVTYEDSHTISVVNGGSVPAGGSICRQSCSKSVLDFSPLRDPCFVCFLIATSATTMASVCPGFYLIRYAQDIGISDEKAVWLLSICRGIYIASGPLIGLITSYCEGDTNKSVRTTGKELNRASTRSKCTYFWRSTRRTKVVAFLQLFAGLTLAMPLLSESYNGFLAYAILSGFATGPLASLAITVLADLFGLEKLPSTLSFRSFLSGIFTLITPPFIGHLVDVYGTYRPAQYVCCSLAIIAACLTFLAHAIMIRRKMSSNDSRMHVEAM